MSPEQLDPGTSIFLGLLVTFLWMRIRARQNREGE